MADPILRYCAKGSEVVRLQLMLRELNFSLQPDGFLGPMTREAVKTFQALHSLQPTGEADPLTWEALETHYYSALCMHVSDPVHTIHGNEPNRRETYESIQGAKSPAGREPAELASHVPQAL